MSRSPSIFTPTGDGQDPQAMIAAALATIDGFTARFNARDLAGMDDHLHFPHVILSAEQLIIWPERGQLPATFFADMIAGSGWDRTVYVEQRPVLVSPAKVHIVVDYTRNRADGSVISRHENLWVVTREAGRWGIKQRSY
jgi:hypothetical protein